MINEQNYMKVGLRDWHILKILKVNRSDKTVYAKCKKMNSS